MPVPKTESLDLAKWPIFKYLCFNGLWQTLLKLVEICGSWGIVAATKMTTVIWLPFSIFSRTKKTERLQILDGRFPADMGLGRLPTIRFCRLGSEGIRLPHECRIQGQLCIPPTRNRMTCSISLCVHPHKQQTCEATVSDTSVVGLFFSFALNQKAIFGCFDFGDLQPWSTDNEAGPRLPFLDGLMQV